MLSNSAWRTIVIQYIKWCDAWMRRGNLEGYIKELTSMLFGYVLKK